MAENRVRTNATPIVSMPFPMWEFCEERAKREGLLSGQEWIRNLISDEMKKEGACG